MDDICYMAVETGGTKVLARIVQGDTVLLERRWPTTTAQAAEDALCDVAASSGVAIAAIGIAAFGPVIVDPMNADYGQVLATPKAGWTGSNLRAGLAARLNLAVAIDTDVNAAALAEQTIGAGKGCPSMAYVTVGTGIGAGLVRNGQTLTGALHPEMGHVPVIRLADDETPSACPFHPSCAEGMAAGPAIRARLAGRELADDPASFAAVADYLGQMFATIVLAWSPHRIVAGGGVLAVAGLREAATKRMAMALGAYGGGSAVSGADFVTAPQLEHAGLEGALILARRAAKAQANDQRP